MYFCYFISSKRKRFYICVISFYVVMCLIFVDQFFTCTQLPLLKPNNMLQKFFPIAFWLVGIKAFCDVVLERLGLTGKYFESHVRFAAENKRSLFFQVQSLQQVKCVLFFRLHHSDFFQTSHLIEKKDFYHKLKLKHHSLRLPILMKIRIQTAFLFYCFPHRHYTIFYKAQPHEPPKTDCAFDYP